MMALPPNERILKEWGGKPHVFTYSPPSYHFINEARGDFFTKKIKKLNFFWILGFMPFFNIF